MFKSSARVLFVVGCAAFWLQGLAQGPEAAATATAPAQAAPSKPLELADNAPDRYTVQPGDTLWSIASKFLKEPWRWPELWRYNKDQIRDPHAIYPGYVLTLERGGAKPSVGATAGPSSAGTAQAAAPGGAAGQAPAESASSTQAAQTEAPRLVITDRTVKLSPSTRITQLGPEAIPTIPRSAIEPWLTRPLIVDDAGEEDEDADDGASKDNITKAARFDALPHVIATEEGRYNSGIGDKIYVTGIGQNNAERDWQIYRRGSPLIDPDTNETIAHEAVYLGKARMLKLGDPSILQIVAASQEISSGDRLIPVTRGTLPSYLPHAPETPVRARVISVVGNRSDAGLLSAFNPTLASSRGDLGYEARREAGPMQLITINKGSKDGLEFGHVLALHRGKTMKFDQSVGPYYLGAISPETTRLPEERYGLIFIIRAFDRVSYALVMEASQPLVPGDLALKP